MEIVLIGTGNTAHVLGKKLKAGGNRILQVAGRNPVAAATLANALGAQAISDFKKIDINAPIIIIAVSDAAISEVAEAIGPTKAIIVHTAGSVSINVLNKASNYGVFYPLQSMNKENEALPEVPIIIDANNTQALQTLQTLAESVSGKVWHGSDEERQKLHLAAVFSNNFVNHLYTLAAAYCTREGVDFSMLIPLIEQTANRLNNIAPKDAQTGPAVRNDVTTIQKHMDLLQAHPQIATIYQLLTQSIIENKNKGF